MGWIGPTAAVHQYLAVVGADQGADGRYIISGEPVTVGLGGDELVIPDGTVYFVGGVSKNLAAGLRSTSQGLGVKVYDQGPGYQANPHARVNPEDFAQALLDRNDPDGPGAWEHMWLEDESEQGPLSITFEVECPEARVAPPDGADEKDGWDEDAWDEKVEKATQARIVRAVRQFLDAELASIDEGQQAFGGRGWGPKWKPTWPGAVVGHETGDGARNLSFEVEVPVPRTANEMARTLYVLGRLDQALSDKTAHFIPLCGLKAKARKLHVPPRQRHKTGMTPEYRKALQEQKDQQEAAKKADAERKAIEKLKKGHYRTGPIERTPEHGYRIPILYRGKQVATMYAEHDGRRIVSMTKFVWAGPAPQSTGLSAQSPEAALFHDAVFPLRTPVADVFAGAVDRLEAMRKWRAAYLKKHPAAKKRWGHQELADPEGIGQAAKKKPAAKKQPAVVQRLRKTGYVVKKIGRGFTVQGADGEVIGKGLTEADLRRLEKDGAPGFSSGKKPAKKKPAKKKPAKKKPAKKKPAKKKPAAKKPAAKKKRTPVRAAAKRPAKPPDPTDLLAMARWARGE